MRKVDIRSKYYARSRIATIITCSNYFAYDIIILHGKIPDDGIKTIPWCNQGGITCGAIDEPRKSSKAIDKRVIIDFRDKNVVIARFRDKNEVFI